MEIELESKLEQYKVNSNDINNGLRLGSNCSLSKRKDMRKGDALIDWAMCLQPHTIMRKKIGQNPLEYILTARITFLPSLRPSV